MNMLANNPMIKGIHHSLSLFLWDSFRGSSVSDSAWMSKFTNFVNPKLLTTPTTSTLKLTCYYCCFIVTHTWSLHFSLLPYLLNGGLVSESYSVGDRYLSSESTGVDIRKERSASAPQKSDLNSSIAGGFQHLKQPQ